MQNSSCIEENFHGPLNGWSCEHLEENRKIPTIWAFSNHAWLVVTGTMEWIMTFQKHLGMSSSQVTFIFFRGVGIPPTSCFVTDFPQTNPLINAQKVLGVVEKSAKPEDVYVFETMMATSMFWVSFVLMGYLVGVQQLYIVIWKKIVNMITLETEACLKSI